ncbi:MAG: TadE/TadG family type IV pilus assembly protein [Pseudolabrys sp.]
MFDRNGSKFAARLHRLLPVRVARRFGRQQDGAAAVEFALIAAPFIGLTFAILETALVFFAGQTLETAASEAGRLIMTGQAQNAGYSQSDFKTQVCSILNGGLFDCSNGVYVNVQNYSSFGAVNNTPPVTNGQLNTGAMAYSPSGPGCIVAVQLYYQWPIYVTFFGDNLTNLNNGYRLLVATTVFRNEPYGPAGTC